MNNRWRNHYLGGLFSFSFRIRWQQRDGIVCCLPLSTVSHTQVCLSLQTERRVGCVCVGGGVVLRDEDPQLLSQADFKAQWLSFWNDVPQRGTLCYSLCPRRDFAPPPSIKQLPTMVQWYHSSTQWCDSQNATAMKMKKSQHLWLKLRNDSQDYQETSENMSSLDVGLRMICGTLKSSPKNSLTFWTWLLNILIDTLGPGIASQLKWFLVTFLKAVENREGKEGLSLPGVPLSTVYLTN